MNFIRNNFTASRRGLSAPVSESHVPPTRTTDHDVACFETYQRHWLQLEETINREGPVNEDKILTVKSHMEHVVSLVVDEMLRNISTSACIDHFLKNDIYFKVCKWGYQANNEDLTTKITGHVETLLETGKRTGNKDLQLIREPSIYRPICLIMKKRIAENEGQLESILLSISTHVCHLIVREPSFLDYFYEVATVDEQPSFPLMSLLIDNLHQSDHKGQLARDNMKLLMGLAKEQQLLAQYVALQSDFCPVVATGLSGLFSALPRQLPVNVERVGLISAVDIEAIKEVKDFVSSLEFCDQILENASWLVTSQLLEYVYNGFLVPVLSPALFQEAAGHDVQLLDSPLHVNTMRQILASTCYLTLCLQRIGLHRGLVGIFVRFLLTHRPAANQTDPNDVELCDQTVIEALVQRLESQSPALRLATLHLLSALVEVDCEDVLVSLVLLHLVPCGHVMLSQQCGNVLQEKDSNCLWAAKFLSLIPSTCHPRFNDVSSSSLTSTSVNQQQQQGSEESSSSTGFRIRSWSKNSNDSENSGNSRYGQLAFTSSQPVELCGVLSDRDAAHLSGYLKDSSLRIGQCLEASRWWTYRYDGQSSPSICQALRMLHQSTSEEEEDDGDDEADDSDAENHDSYGLVKNGKATAVGDADDGLVASPGQSSGYQSFNFGSSRMTPLQQEEALTRVQESANGSRSNESFFSQDVQDDLEFWSLMRSGPDDEDEADQPTAGLTQLPQVEILSQPNNNNNNNNNNKPNRHASKASAHQRPSVGLFLETLVKSVDGWLNNSIEVNLALASILSRLAAYPQPLLRSLLLNPYLILQPSVPGLASSLATLKQRIDSALNANENASNLIEEARSLLEARLPYSYQSHSLATKGSSLTDGQKRAPTSRLARLFSSMVRGKEMSEVGMKEDHFGTNNHRSSSLPNRQTMTESSDPIGSHVAVCAVLLEEWLHELAAICMEHAVSFTPLPIPNTKL